MASSPPSAQEDALRPIIESHQQANLTPVTASTGRGDIAKSCTTQLIAASAVTQNPNVVTQISAEESTKCKTSMNLAPSDEPFAGIKDDNFTNYNYTETRDATAGKSQKLVDFSYVEKKQVLPYHAKWQIPASQHAALEKYYRRPFDHSDIIPPKDAPFHEQVGAYVQRWACWLVEIEDEAKREKLMHLAMSTMDKSWRYGIDKGLFPKYVQDSAGGGGKKGMKREKNDDILLFDEIIESAPVPMFKNKTQDFKVTAQELRATGVDYNALCIRVATRDVAAGEKIYNEFIDELDDGNIKIGDWKNRTETSGANIYGRDLFVFALQQVQLAKQDISKLKSYLPHHHRPNQKGNTLGRIGEQARLLNRWLAIAIELEKCRPKDETDEESDTEMEQADFQEAISSPLPVERNDAVIASSVPEAESLQAGVTLQDTFVPGSKSAQVPFEDHHSGAVEEEVQETPLTPKAAVAPRSLKVKLRLGRPEQPDDVDAQHKQAKAVAGKQNVKRPSKRGFISDSDDDFQLDEEKAKASKKQKKASETPEQAVETGKRADKRPPDASSCSAATVFSGLDALFLSRTQDKPPSWTRTRLIPGGCSEDITHALGPPITPPTQASGLPTPGQTSSTTTTAFNIRLLSTDDKQRRDSYLRTHFLPKVNVLLTARGQSHLRIVPSDFGRVREKLELAHVPKWQRNDLLKEWKSGFLQQTTRQSPSQEQEADATVSGGRRSSNASEPTLLVTLKTFPGFNPANYTSQTLFIIPGFRYHFFAELQDRIAYKPYIEQSVAKVMQGEPSEGWVRRYGKRKDILTPDGRLVVVGWWDQMNGLPAPDLGKQALPLGGDYTY